MCCFDINVCFVCGVLTITCKLTDQSADADVSFKGSITQGSNALIMASPFESFGTCSNSTADGTQTGYYLVCEFGNKTAHLLIENPVQGDEYYCTGRMGNSRSPRTTVSVAGNNLVGYIMSLPSFHKCRITYLFMLRPWHINKGHLAAIKIGTFLCASLRPFVCPSHLKIKCNM